MHQRALVSEVILRLEDNERQIHLHVRYYLVWLRAQLQDHLFDA
jgi:hypothetical protein